MDTQNQNQNSEESSEQNPAPASSETHTDNPPAQTATTPAPATTGEAKPEFDFSEQGIMSALSYVGPLVLVPFLTKKNDPVIMYHVKQGLVVFGLEVAVWFVGSMMFIHVVYTLMTLVNLGLLVLSVIGIVNALKHEQKPLPLIGGWADKINL